MSIFPSRREGFWPVCLDPSQPAEQWANLGSLKYLQAPPLLFFNGGVSLLLRWTPEAALLPTPRHAAVDQERPQEGIPSHILSFLEAKETQGTHKDGFEDAFLTSKGDIFTASSKCTNTTKWPKNPMLAGHLIFKEKLQRSKFLLSWARTKVHPGLPSPSLCG